MKENLTFGGGVPSSSAAPIWRDRPGPTGIPIRWATPTTLGALVLRISGGIIDRRRAVATTNLASTGSWSEQMATLALAMVLIGISLTGLAAMRRES